MTDISGYERQGTSYKWEAVGAILKGEIVRVAEIDHDWPNFNRDGVESMLRFTVANEDGEHGVYCRLKPFQAMGTAIVDAVQVHGPTIDVGAKIAIQRMPDLQTPNGMAHQFVAQYAPPTAGVTLEAVPDPVAVVETPAPAAPAEDLLDF